ncbi:MAG: TrbI/VirB10 family protein [Neisseriaceae bacterium]
MEVIQTTLKKKLILSLIGVLLCGGVAGGVYMVNDYINPAPSTSTTVTKADLPDGTSVNVTVNNMISMSDSNKPKPTPVVDSKPEASLPVIERAKKAQPVQQLMQTPPVATTEQSKPKMLVVNSNNPNIANDSDTNAITGTNTKIGTGEINSQLKTQHSPYTIFAGTFIPAQMITGMNSELNGQIVALVRNDVYDSTTGKYLLIPQGSKLIGTYNHDIAYGQNRLIAGWNRVIYPNGTSFLLRGQPGTDLQGFSGLTGNVDNHWGTRFGSSVLVGLIFGGMTAATGNQATNPNQLSAGATIATQVGAQMSQTGLQVIQKGMDIPPTIIISPGYKFNILTTADLILKPYVYKDKN